MNDWRTTRRVTGLLLPTTIVGVDTRRTRYLLVSLPDFYLDLFPCPPSPSYWTCNPKGRGKRRARKGGIWGEPTTGRKERGKEGGKEEGTEKLKSERKEISDLWIDVRVRTVIGRPRSHSSRHFTLL